MRLSDIVALALVGVVRLFGVRPASYIAARLLPPDEDTEGR